MLIQWTHDVSIIHPNYKKIQSDLSSTVGHVDRQSELTLHAGTSANESEGVRARVFGCVHAEIVRYEKKKKDLWIRHEPFGQCIAICFKEAFSQPL